MPTAIVFLLCGIFFFGFGTLVLKKTYFEWQSENQQILLSSVKEKLKIEFQTTFKNLLEVARKATLKNTIRALPDTDPVFNDRLVRLSAFTPNREGEFVLRQWISEFSVAQHGLSTEYFQQIDQKNPIPLRKIAKRKEDTVFNRTLKGSENQGPALYSFVFFGKTHDAYPEPTLFVADIVWQEETTLATNQDYFVVNAKGHILWHPILQKLASSEKFLSEELFDKIHSHESDTFSLWETIENRFTTVTPGPFSGTYMVAQNSIQSFNDLVVSLSTVCFAVSLAGFSILGIILLLNLRFQHKQLIRFAEGIKQIDSGIVPSRRSIIRWAEWRELSNIFEKHLARLSLLMAEKFEEGRQESEKMMAQMVRTSLTPPTQIQNDKIELISFRAPTHHESNDFWDIYLSENRLRIWMGTCNTKGMSAALLIALAKTELDTCRSSYPNSQQMLSKEAEHLNERVYKAYKGRYSLNVTGIELDLNSGKLTIINAGQDLGPVFGIGGDKAKALPALGTEAKNTYTPNEITMRENSLYWLNESSITNSENPLSLEANRSNSEPLNILQSRILESLAKQGSRKPYSLILFKWKPSASSFKNAA
jgi:hypothetical protein